MMESGKRSFLITGDPVFLEKYESGKQFYLAVHSAMQRETPRDSELYVLLEKVDRELDKWQTQVAEPLINLRYAVNRNEAQLEQVIQGVISRAGRETFTRISQIMDQFASSEEELLYQLSESSAQSLQSLQIVLIGGPGIIIVLGTLLTLVTAGNIDHRLKSVTQASLQMAGGRIHDHYDLPEGRDEVGRLATAFRQMAETIRRQLEEQQRTNEELRAANATKVAKEYLEQIVQEYSAFAEEIARGNLTVRLQVSNNNDDLSLLGQQLNAMVDGLRTIAAQV
ncbi:HAMP domain-containing protein [Chloroflexus sp.]|uniref:HAMP domain-containing protein n=1 Tax=Chloroflexus sp. TaxID=1904827 RepID=UPI002ADD4168|nr:HAMP domain-containing protein [Chloroflexus sp.]